MNVCYVITAKVETSQELRNNLVIISIAGVIISLNS